jgi:hypothetical protein
MFIGGMLEMLLAKRNWGVKNVASWNNSASLLWCQTKTIWWAVHVTIGLTPQKLIAHMLKNWLTCISNKERSLIFVWAAALMWAIWRTCNDLIFEEKQFTSYLCRLSTEERTRRGFFIFCSMRIQGRPSVLEIFVLDICQEWMEKQ